MGWAVRIPVSVSVCVCEGKKGRGADEEKSKGDVLRSSRAAEDGAFPAHQTPATQTWIMQRALCQCVQSPPRRDLSALSTAYCVLFAPMVLWPGNSMSAASAATIRQGQPRRGQWTTRGWGRTTGGGIQGESMVFGSCCAAFGPVLDSPHLCLLQFAGRLRLENGPWRIEIGAPGHKSATATGSKSTGLQNHAASASSDRT